MSRLGGTPGEARGASSAEGSTVAALFVERGGVYWDLEGVDPWDEARDARTYAGPHPVVAHPPCARWGRLWYRGGHAKGSDSGCFAAALNAVRMFGGVLEHPAHSSAWAYFGLPRPSDLRWASDMPRDAGWVCEVEQGHYGHRGRKRTWLYAVTPKVVPPPLAWGPSSPPPSVNSTPQILPAGRRASRTGVIQRMSKKQRAATPPAFRDLLLSIARSAAVRRMGEP